MINARANVKNDDNQSNNHLLLLTSDIGQGSHKTFGQYQLNPPQIQQQGPLPLDIYVCVYYIYIFTLWYLWG